MNIIVLIPRVVSRYIASFSETTNNAYKYFNYDHRVVEERVNRGDPKSSYVSPSDVTDAEYDMIVTQAVASMNPILKRYSPSVACEDALHTVIKSFANGRYDSKINASKYNVLLCEMKKKIGVAPSDVENYKH